MKSIVLGGGAWGISIAYLLHIKNIDVSVWEYDKESCEKLQSTRYIKERLGDFRIPDEISFTNEITENVKEADIVINAVPTQFIRSYFKYIKDIDFTNKIVVNVSKGIEVSSGKDIRNIFIENFDTITDDNFAILAGPSFAKEVTLNPTPTTVVASSKNIETANTIRDLFSSPYFRVYSNCDVVGVEIGGSIKNVIAIAAGMLDGMDLGNNTKAALLTRGLAEMTRFGVAVGAKRETFSGLTGIGDMILTCNSNLSRNYQVGYRIGKGEKLKDILDDMVMVAEGVETARIAYKLSKDNGVQMPITEMVNGILFEDIDPKAAIKKLMLRERKEED
ncbi:MAG: glycerol-3-phosphate dehydrogenase [Candidatus Delongbacteria bacterium]|nr:MAG: glycerol-3-phosphate dehydrogenase [Candidatus Delongbacteria bacterium]